MPISQEDTQDTLLCKTGTDIYNVIWVSQAPAEMVLSPEGFGSSRLNIILREV